MSIFIEQWKAHQTQAVKTMYPELEDEKIDKLLEKMISEQMVNPKATLHNNYEHKALNIDLLSVIDWIDRVKPIIAGFGCFFKNQDTEINPTATMLNKFIKSRKAYKKRLEDFPSDSEEYATFDRLQLTEKINVNSYYGCSGATTSNYFNLYTAQACTATGQSLISTTCTTFEYFMADNNPFFTLDECMTFLNFVVNKDQKMDDSFIPNVKREQVYTRIVCKFYDWKQHLYEEPIRRYLDNLDQSQLKRVYYSNNLYEFSRLDKIRKLLIRIIGTDESFMNPNKLPNDVIEPINKLWAYYEEFVLYNNFAFERISRLKTKTRKSVTTIDTDSNMVSLLPWINFVKGELMPESEKMQNKDPNELIFASINTMAFALTKVVTEVLNKYTAKCNILPSFQPNINMKNEFLFLKQILANVKKRYITNVILREGNLVSPTKIDIKGFDFVKSTTTEETKGHFIDLIKKYILFNEDIDVIGLVQDLEKFQESIYDSLRKGEKKYLTPTSVKEVEGYADPFKMQGVRGVFAWNAAYPDQEIQLPEKLDLVKVKLTAVEDLEPLKDIDFDIYKNLKQGIFGSRIDKIQKKGVAVIAIPRNVERIPDWIIPFIDYDEIVNNVMKKFYPVLDSLGMEIFTVSDRTYHSNILEL